MKNRFSTAFCQVAALAIFSVAALAQTPTMTKTTPTATKTTAAKTTAKAPKPDADIQKCIQDKLNSGKLKADGLSAAVNGGEATLTGTTKVAGHKGNATQFAKSCGATKVTNNITVEAAPKKEAKPAAKKP